jgi:hypothetical protein
MINLHLSRLRERWLSVSEAGEGLSKMNIPHLPLRGVLSRKRAR